ncbi:MAG: Flp pilus assembly complex ATPase component TadA [Desulfobacteraceae bacterium]|nr:Flp pilus assembly complex ATPase component TadA [Desulfobacteraceae bacterium]
MNSPVTPLILCVDDDHDILRLMERFLTRHDYNVTTVDSGEKALLKIDKTKPDIVLLDIMMPGMDGFEVCSRLQKNEETAYIPVIFVTALGGEQDKDKAFSAGAVDYLVKPIQEDTLIQKVRSHLETNTRWEKLPKDITPLEERIHPSDFLEFKKTLSDQLKLAPDMREKLAAITYSKIYSISADTGVTNSRLARYMADFLRLDYLSYINPENVKLGALPTPFCRKNSVVTISDDSGNDAFVLSNPFNLELLDLLKKYSASDQKIKLIVTEPKNIESLLEYSSASGKMSAAPGVKHETVKPTFETPQSLSEAEMGKRPVVHMANNIFNAAVSERASDIHIEPKETNTVVRFRIDGDMKEFFSLKKDTGIMLISRLKVLAGLDIAEKRKSQDGAFEVNISNRAFHLRIVTTSTPHGESVVVRLLEPTTKPKGLNELGMTDEQAGTMIGLARRTQGLLLIVGPTGSGKTTTIYSLLANIDCKTRSLISVEDPVEYRIPFANQQQVDEKVGVTFDSLLKSSVRQDPDILFMGEVRDQYSAKISLDFASTGHLTITSLHTSNATTAIFRLERFETDRRAMADTILGVVAQRLLKKLCPHCKKIVPTSKDEIDMLAPFTDVVPSRIAHPVGCWRCNNTGYYGREGVYEILQFDREIAEMVRTGTPISHIREFVRKRGGYLISNHALEKVKEFLLSPKDVYEKVLVEEKRFKGKGAEKEERQIPVAREKIKEKASILLVEDDKDSQKLIARFLENSDYKVTIAQDGIDALLNIGKKDFDLIISDINMPNLDGFKLLEMMNQKDIEAPVMFLTSRTSQEDEIKGFELGATDYIRKPVKKDVLLLRVTNVLERHKK